MADKIPNIINALANLERQYVEHKEKFEKWKVDNVKQRGSETYNRYVEQFHQWEMNVKEQQRLLIDERNNLVNSSDVDVALDSLLTRLSMKDFVLAVVTMTSKDSSFFPELLSAFKRIQTSGDNRHIGNAYRPYAQPPGPYSQNFVQAYAPHQYGSTTMSAATAVHPYATPPPTAHPPPMKRTFDNVLTKAPSSSGTSQLGPKMDEPPRKSYRAPSPVKDYRNPSTLAFRDFSQT